jgi:glycosyltransferase involved in cell wall biosynthesis
MQSASLIVCTYKRAFLLSRLLSSICELEMPKELNWELIVVDNNSKDNTRQIVEKFQASLPMRYFLEEKQGKTYALNRALSFANGELLLFTDDDTILHPEWASAFIDAGTRVTDAGWFGGRVKPDWSASPPVWYREETAAALSGYFGDYDLGPTSRLYSSDDKLPLGASLAIRREVFNTIGNFRTDLGPRGKLRGVGDETEFLERAVSAGFKGYYVAEARVLHHVGPERLALSGFLNYGIGKGLNQYVIGTENGRKGSVVRAAGQLLRAIPQALKGRGDRARICLINVGIELGRTRASRASGT